MARRATTHVRISETTHQRLQLLARQWERAASNGHMEQWWDGDSGPTIDEMVRRLMDHLHNDRRRMRESAARRRDRSRQAIWGTTWEPSEK